MARAENVETFEQLRNRIHGDAAAELQPLTAAQVEELRPLVRAAHDHYQTTGRDTGQAELHEDALVNALAYLASVRSGSGSSMPFGRALDEVLRECTDVREA